MENKNKSGERFYLGVQKYIHGTPIHYLHLETGQDRRFYAWLGATTLPEVMEAYRRGEPIEDYFEETSYKKTIFKRIKTSTTAMSVPSEEEFRVFVSRELMDRIRNDKTNEWSLASVFEPFNRGDATWSEIDPSTGEPIL